VATACRHRGSGATREAPVVIAVRDQLATRESQAGPIGVAERSVLPTKPGNSGRGKGPQLNPAFFLRFPFIASFSSLIWQHPARLRLVCNSPQRGRTRPPSATSPPCKRSPKPEPRFQSGIEAPVCPRSYLPHAASCSMPESTCSMPVSPTSDDPNGRQALPKELLRTELGATLLIGV
jgi:hypothetical protein